jgi:superfamily II DNA or RNA helicase
VLTEKSRLAPLGIGLLTETLRGEVREFCWRIEVPGFESFRAMFENQFAVERRFLEHVSLDGFPRLREATTSAAGVKLAWELRFGESLRDVAAKAAAKRMSRFNAPLTDLPRVIYWARSLAETLVRLHRQRPYPYVHGDISPDSVALVSHRDSLQLDTLGIPRSIINLWRKSSPASDWKFPDPACSSVSNLLPSNDIYGFGWILDFLLTGVAREPRELQPHSVAPSLALDDGGGHFARLVRIVESCCRQNPSDRPSTMEWVLAELPMIDPRETTNEPRRCRCGHRVGASARFCDGCGAPLSSTTPSTSKAVTVEYDVAAEASALDSLKSGHVAPLEVFQLFRLLEDVQADVGSDTLSCLDGLPQVERLPYQLEAARRVLGELRGRALLADEVGLGKTIEAGIVLKELIVRKLARHVLIICPPHLCDQWQSELYARFDEVFLVMGRDVETSLAWSCDRLIAPYPIVEQRFHADELKRQDIDLLVVDEAHYLNERQNSKALDLVRMLKKRYFLLLSATPMHGELWELHNIITLLRPGHFGSLDAFLERYESRSSPTKVRDADELRKTLRQVMIRNLRTTVANTHKLPTRIARRIECRAAPDALQFYEEFQRVCRAKLATVRNEWLVADVSQLAECLTSSPGAFAASLAGLRRSIARQLGNSFVTQLEGFAVDARASQLIEPKVLEALGHAENARKSGSKVLIFSQYNESAQYLYSRACASGMGSHSLWFDETSSSAKKGEVLRAFRDSPNSMILFCPGEASEGLNLQFAQVMINYDLPWDPMRIEQRIGRIQRYGSPFPEVVIINLVLHGTIEIEILNNLEKMIVVVTAVVGTLQDIVGRLGDDEDFRGLYRNVFLNRGRNNANGDSESAIDSLHRVTDRILSETVSTTGVSMLNTLVGDDFTDTERENWH